MAEAFDLAALALRRLAVNATARATMAGVFDRKPILGKVPQSHPLCSGTMGLCENETENPSIPSESHPSGTGGTAPKILPENDGASPMVPSQSHRIGTIGNASDSDAEHIAAVPPLPAPGTPARDALDIQQADMCAGLLRCADPSREPRRVEAWVNPDDRAVPGDRCRDCNGRWWRLTKVGAGGCFACCPPHSWTVDEARYAT